MRQFAQQEIGERIAQARKESGGMTQEELAELLNVSKRSVQDYEAGTTVPWKYFQLLEEVFKRPLSWFLHGEEEQLPQDLAQQLADAMDALVAVAGRFESAATRLEALLPAETAPAPSGRKRR